ncbi:MAG: Uridine kinase [Candidatus Bipolaricaulis sibiricus]|uniref:Uridine kinase n=1 Tax=Bipolaricaulis sibiricus TaxID=2501609 RepID=A0A410FT90_BIPS1|nr:MAG: Uridine kinase [Candidatus Bipolaricaulis sibiricus]
MAQVRPSKRRETVQAVFPDDRAFEGPTGTPLADFVLAAYPEPQVPAVAAIVDGELRELSFPLREDASVRPVFLTDSEGIRIYTRSLSFLLAAAVDSLFPEARLIIDHSVPFGGYYCRVVRRPLFTPEELGRIEAHMRDLVRADAPIVREEVALTQAQARLCAQGLASKAELLVQGGIGGTVPLYRLGQFEDYLFGPMVPSTGFLRWFALAPYPRGFILRFPRRERPTELAPAEDYSALLQVFEEYGHWLDLLGVYDACTVNEAVRTGRMTELILVSEALHNQRIAQIAEAIADHPSSPRLILIAGPSSSGKTTFTKRLAIQLLSLGLRPYPVSMDDYFLPRDEMARRGLTDFDDVSAVEVPLFRHQMEELLAGKTVRLPRFDFATGQREVGSELKLKEDGILLVEGLHCLNPDLLPSHLDERSFRIYASALTQLNLDDHVRMSTTDTRLLRRVVRDAAYRGYTAEDTLRMWDNVRRGEKRFVFPHQGRADVMFNSALVFEWNVLRSRVEPLLLQVRHPRLRLRAERLLEELRWFVPYPGDEIPATSILREFIGGGILAAYYPSPFERATWRRET